MAVQYFVVLHEGQWKVKVGDRHTGAYDSQRQAIKAAVEAAQKGGSATNTTQVIVQGEDHKFRAEWTYGKDPYPPKG